MQRMGRPQRAGDWPGLSGVGTGHGVSRTDEMTRRLWARFDKSAPRRVEAVRAEVPLPPRVKELLGCRAAQVISPKGIARTEMK
jgi:hypothetical protein